MQGYWLNNLNHKHPFALFSPLAPGNFLPCFNSNLFQTQDPHSGGRQHHQPAADIHPVIFWKIQARLASCGGPEKYLETIINSL